MFSLHFIACAAERRDRESVLVSHMVRFVSNCLSSSTRLLRCRVVGSLPLTAQVEEIQILFVTHGRVLFILQGLLAVTRLLWVGYGRVCLSQQGIHFRHWSGRLLMIGSPDFALVSPVLCE